MTAVSPCSTRDAGLSPFTLIAICRGLLFAVPKVCAGAEKNQRSVRMGPPIGGSSNKTEINDGGRRVHFCQADRIDGKALIKDWISVS